MSKKQSTAPDDGVAGRSSGSRYAEEFKRDAVRLVSEEKYSFRAAATAGLARWPRLKSWLWCHCLLGWVTRVMDRVPLAYSPVLIGKRHW